MVASPGDYRWSSFRANIGRTTDPLLTPHAVFLALGGSAEQRYAGYRELFDEHLARH